MLSGILDKAVSGTRLTFDEGETLFDCNDLTLLGTAAHKVRLAHGRPETVTYISDRNINYTNICTSKCAFCAFHRETDADDAYVLDDTELFRKIEETVRLGGRQILMQGGMNPELPFEYYTSILKEIKSHYDVHLHCFSPPEIVFLAHENDLTIEQVIWKLKEAGLDTIPGGGAEILVDEVRSRVSPGKCTSDEWIEVMRTAHALGIRTTSTMMFGHVESFRDRITHLERIRSLQDDTGGFTAFIPWTFQPGNTPLEGKVEPSGGFDYLRTLAISRLYLDNIDNIQASWVTQGAKMGQLALFFGANDFGSTMIEENVVRAAGTEFRMKPEEIERVITDAGFTPRQRDCYYRYMT